jgi:hypothetical protein
MQVQLTHPQLQHIHAAQQQIPQVQAIQAIPQMQASTQLQDAPHMPNVQPVQDQPAAQLPPSQQVPPQQQLPPQHKPWNPLQHQQLLTQPLANVSYDDESGTIGFIEYDALCCGNTISKDVDNSHFHQMQSGCDTDSNRNSSVRNMQPVYGCNSDIYDGDAKVHSNTTFRDSDKCKNSELLQNCQMAIPDLTQHSVKRGVYQEVKAKYIHDAGSKSLSTDEPNSGYFLGFAKHMVTVRNWTFEMDSPGNLHNELELFRKLSFPEPSEHTKHKAPGV